MLTITISTKAAVIAVAAILLGIAMVPFANSRADGEEPEAATESRVPVETAFQYQGRLELNGVPANGTHTLGFTLYSDAVANSVVGNPITATMPVTNGSFSVPLDFGEGAFNGNARWIGVEALVGNSFVPVGTRQQIRATPYALHSLTTGPHSHFGDTWTGSGLFGLSIENTTGTAITANSTKVGVSTTGFGDNSLGMVAVATGAFAQGVYSVTSGSNSKAFRAEAFGAGAIGIQAYGELWAGDFDGSIRVSAGIRADDVLPTYPSACTNGCYVGDTVKPWTAMYAGAFNVLSDARKKRDVTGLPYGLSEILALRPVSYSFIDDESAKTRLGLIAQEVEQVMPEVVTPPASDDAFYAMSYDDLIPVLIKAIQELDAKVATQEAEIGALKNALGID